MSNLTREDVSRYSRQLILPELGIRGQLKLSESSCLLVGAGGLACPAGLYLASGGVGRIGVVDYDKLDLSNLHRQVIYKEEHVGTSKAEAFVTMLKGLNSGLQYVAHNLLLDSKNALNILRDYDVIVDATDNVATRYLLNDACVLLHKPLVSGSALRWEGQLTTYNYNDGPCYRCLFPTPPPPDTVTNCSDGGVLGVIPGIIGTLQALEVIKILTNQEPSYWKKLLLYDGRTGDFRSIKLRSKQDNCQVCGSKPSITQLLDYVQFCRSSPTDRTESLNVLTENDRITCEEYKSLIDSNEPHVLVDVRSPLEMEICKIPNSLNIPFELLELPDKVSELQNVLRKVESAPPKQLFVVCRRGNNSQLAVQILQEKLENENLIIKDLKGGLQAWSEEVDKEFHIY